MYTSQLRQQQLDGLGTESFDVAVVGGGINGAVAVAALSAAGLRVVLLEQKDFASSTSQESSNLVWGGIKYLESYEFGLVWDLCRSRNELMRSYPLEVQELRFFTTLARGFRKPRFLVYLGAVLYWLMGRLATRPPRLLSIADIEREEPLVVTGKSQGGLEYSDCFLRDNDARFVFHFIRRAIKAGATALNYVRVEKLSFHDGNSHPWQIEAKELTTDRSISLRAKVVINAAGPFADGLNRLAGIRTKHRHIFSKGVHLIVRRLSSHDRVLTFFADDGRLFFVIPMGTCSCIGTTDTRVKSLPAVVEAEDRQFILDNINKRLRLAQPLQESDIIAERCGVRPLVVRANAQDTDQEDWVNLSRKHEIEVDAKRKHISIFGGKLTDCLNIGRELLDELEELGMATRFPSVWYGEGAAAAKTHFADQAARLGLQAEAVAGEGTLADRLWRTYGEDALSIVDILHRHPEDRMPVVAGASVIMAEVRYMAVEEMVVSLEDFLRRRTRLALTVPREQLLQSSQLVQACQLLFGSEAGRQWQQYFNSQIPA